MLLQFYALIYMADNAFYQDGKTVPIYCNHVRLEDCGINTQGEIVQLPTSRTVSPPVNTVAIEPGNIFPSPTQFGDAGFKAVTKIKDMVTLTEYYVDTTSYNANVVNCNPAD